MNLILRAGNGGPIFCERLIAGRPPVSLVTLECPPDANATQPPATIWRAVTMVEMFIMDGRQMPWPRRNGGPAEDYRVRFDVDARGVVTLCEPVARWDMDPETQAIAQRRCDRLKAGGRALFLPDASRPVRHAEFAMASVASAR